MAQAVTSPAAAKATFYVSPNGRDDFSGRLANTNAAGTDGPFATVRRARDAVRAHRSAHPGSGPVEVRLRGGTYPLDEPLIFEPRDSGTDQADVLYAAYPGEQPILSGGRAISGWRTGTINGATCWMADLPEVAAGRWSFTQLFVNGVRRPRTRLPREGFYRFAALPEGRQGLFKGARSAQFHPGEIRRWKNLGDVRLIALEHSFESHLGIELVDEANHIVHFTHASISDLNDEQQLPARYYIENVSEALAEPGQWHLDTATGVLYYLPLPDERLESAVVIAPRLASLVRFAGTPDSPVAHIRLENLAFCHAEFSLPPGNPGGAQAAYNVPGAIVLRCADSCALYGCEINRLGQYGIEIQAGSTRNAVVACTLFDLGAGAIRVNNERPMPVEDRASPAWEGLDVDALGWTPAARPVPVNAPGLVSARTLISDCTIRDCGVIYPSAVGLWIGDSGRNRIRHNHIHGLNYTAISVGWTWGYEPVRAHGNLVEFNHIHDIGRGILSDMGGIYLLGAQPGTIVRGNRVHDITSNGYGGWGIYADEGSSYLLIENNITCRTKSGGFHQHYGRDNLVRNNIFSLAVECQVFRTRCETVRSFVFEGNIVYHQKGPTVEATPDHAVFRRNVYFNRGGSPRFGTMSFNEWRQAGQDAGSIVADPLLDPETGRISRDSPALTLRFGPIDGTAAGPRFGQQRRPASFADWPPDEDPPVRIVEVRLEPMAADAFFSAMNDARSHHHKPQLHLSSATPEPVSIIVRNLGDLPAGGAVRLRINPPEAGTIRGEVALAYQLEPGQFAATTAEVVLADGADRLLLEAVDQESDVVSAIYYRRKV